MKRHVTFVAVAEIRDGIFRPLIGFGQQHAVAIFLVDVLAQLAQRLVRLRQVLAVGALALVKIGHGVQPQPIDAHVEPEVHGGEHGFFDFGVVPVEIGLVGIEAVPVVGLGHWVPRPVGVFEVLKDDAGVCVLLWGVAPDIEVAPARSRRRTARALKPDVLIGRVIEHELGDHLQAAAMCLAQKLLEVF